MPLGRKGKRHTAKEHRIFNAISRGKSGRKLSPKSRWKITMAMSSKQRNRKTGRPNTINYRRGKRRRR